jgi:hypothetical protein
VNSIFRFINESRDGQLAGQARRGISVFEENA